MSPTTILEDATVPRNELANMIRFIQQTAAKYEVSDRNSAAVLFGHSGTRFSEKGLKEAIDRLKPLFIDKSPIENPPKIPEKIQWVQPRLVCEVAYAEWTEHEQLRQTTFLGWRDDKDSSEVVLETQP